MTSTVRGRKRAGSAVAAGSCRITMATQLVSTPFPQYGGGCRIRSDPHEPVAILRSEQRFRSGITSDCIQSLFGHGQKVSRKDCHMLQGGYHQQLEGDKL